MSVLARAAREVAAQEQLVWVCDAFVSHPGGLGLSKLRCLERHFTLEAERVRTSCPGSRLAGNRAGVRTRLLWGEFKAWWLVAGGARHAQQAWFLCPGQATLSHQCRCVRSHSIAFLRSCSSCLCVVFACLLSLLVPAVFTLLRFLQDPAKHTVYSANKGWHLLRVSLCTRCSLVSAGSGC